MEVSIQQKTKEAGLGKMGGMGKENKGINKQPHGRGTSLQMSTGLRRI